MTLNVVPVLVLGINDFRYLITTSHWLTLLWSPPENHCKVLGRPHVVLAHCTSHEAALAAFRLLNGDL